MADAVFIIHDKASVRQAEFLCSGLNRSGIFAITLDMAAGNSSNSEIQENWPEIASYVPVFIILAGPKLFTDRYLSEMALDVIGAKKAICVLCGFCPDLPSWFTANYVHISFGDSRGMNQLIHALNRYVSLWDYGFRSN